RPYHISVTRLVEPEQEPAARGFVVAADGDGFAALLAAEGAQVVAGAPGSAEVLGAVRATGAGQVVVLLDRSCRAGADAAAEEAEAAGVRVAVVPVCSPVQAL